MGNSDRIVLHIPHASPAFPFGVSGWEEGIAAEVNRWTDWYTDWLFASSSRLDGRIVAVQYPFSRFFCDAERLENDPLEALGQGMVYERFGGLHRVVSGEEKAFAIRTYTEHRERLRRAVSGKDTILIDCHSFPPDLSDVEVCIGVNGDWSRPDDSLLDQALRHFRRAGYRTEINDPYSNSITPECGFPYTSLMLEVNKGTYLSGDGQLDYGKALALRDCLEGFLLSLLAPTRSVP